jgi:hypothetical protein
MRDTVAAGWWSQALHNYHNLHRTAIAEDITVQDLPVVSEEQVALFEATLRQQLHQQLRRSGRKKDKASNHPQKSDGCDLVLFVDDSGICNELAQAAAAAGIGCLQQMLPEHVVMMVYSDQVQVRSNTTQDDAVRVLWSAQEEIALQNSLRLLSRYLGITERKLRPMVDAGQLKIQQQGTHLHFTCDGITAVIDEPERSSGP